MSYTKEELCLIWLDSFLGLEYKHKAQLFKFIDGKTDIKELIVKGKEYITSFVGQNEYETLLNSTNQVYLDYVIKGLDDRDITAITLVSKGYPEKLKQTEIPPLVLYCKGDVNLLNAEIFGVVGSRRSLPSQKNICKSFCESLGNADFTLITGIAEGVDQTVLETAMENKFKVISVIAGGFDNVYPKSNENLLNRVIENGLVITEYPPEIVPKPYQFPVRNRIIAGLSSGVLIVSGGLKSGTMYTAEYAFEYGREVFAVPYSIGVESGKGCNELIKRSAHLADTPQDILEFFNKEEKKTEVSLDDNEKEVISVLKDGDKHIDKICSLLNKEIYIINPILMGLEIKGVIVKNGFNIYGLKKPCLEE